MFGSIRSRILVGSYVLTVTLAIVCSVTIAALSRLGEAVRTVLRENYVSVVACQDMKEALDRQDAAALLAATGRSDMAVPMLETHRAAFVHAFSVESHNITIPGEGDAVREIDALNRGYAAAVDAELAAPSGDRLGRYFGDALPRFESAKARIQDVLRMNQTQMERADGEVHSVARRSERFALALSVLALVFAVFFIRRMSRTIVDPVTELSDVARVVGEGNLDVSVTAPSVRELAPLAEALRRMVAKLRVYRDSSLGELLAAKDLANATVACLLDPVVVLTSDRGILLTNAAAEASFGLRVGSRDELRDDDIAIPDEFLRACDRVMSTGQPVSPLSFSEAMRQRGRDNDRYYLIRAAPLRSEAGATQRAIVVAQDVTRFRRIDDLKTEMVATVSHEFKTPLTSLRMATYLLLEASTGPLTDNQRELVTTARDETERLRAMVDELLDLVRIEADAGALRRVKVDPAKLLNGAIEAHRAIANEKGVTLVIDSAPARGVTWIDAEKLSIVLANLLSNAIRHTPRGGSVNLSAVLEPKSVQFTVKDTGEGIDAHELQGLLAASPRVSHRQGRHGLGLTIAREIIIQHGGELNAESSSGQGSTFTVTLPNDAEGVA